MSAPSSFPPINKRKMATLDDPDEGDAVSFGVFPGSKLQAPVSAVAPAAPAPVAAVSPVPPMSRVGGANAGGNSVGSFKYSNGQRVEVRDDGREAVYGPGNKFQGYRTPAAVGAAPVSGSSAAQPAAPVAAVPPSDAFRQTGSSISSPAEVERRRQERERSDVARAAYSASRPAAAAPAPVAAASPFQLVVSKADGSFYGETKAGAGQGFKTEEEARAFSSGSGDQQAATNEARATNDFLSGLNDENDARLAKLPEPVNQAPAAPAAVAPSGPVAPAPRPPVDQMLSRGLSSLSVEAGAPGADPKAISARAESLKRGEAERLRKIKEEKARVKAAEDYKAEGQRKLDAMARGY